MALVQIAEAGRERPSLDWARAVWGELEGLALLRAALTGPFALFSPFGAESAVLLNMVASVDRRTPVVFLETDKLFPETLAYKDELVAWLWLEDVRSISPDPGELARLDGAGNLWQREPDLCCHIRKTEPLDLALSTFVGWITGRRRFQGGTRAKLPAIESDPVTGQIKLNPLAGWSLDDIRHYRRLRQLPQHPLVAQGYPSIGCLPCTRPVREGEPVRAGRWWQLDTTECRIHRGEGI